MRKFLIYLFIVLNVGLVSSAWWSNSGSFFGSLDGSLIALGRLFGLYAELGIIFMMVLMGRILWIEEAFGHDNMNRLHRRLGYSLTLFLIGHPVLLGFGYSKANGLSFWQQIVDFLAWHDVLKAIVGLGLLVGVITFSLPWIRRHLKYEHWHAIHLLVYVVFVLVIGHQTNGGDLSSPFWTRYWYGLNFGLLALVGAFRFLRPIWLLQKHSFEVQKIVTEAPDSFSVYIKGKKLEDFKFKPGQFANFIFLNKGQRTPHPFSFSISPNPNHLRITAKEVGDFTRTIKDIPPGTKVLVDGPLGRFTLDVARKDKFLLIAGGIGITPIRALAEEISKKGKDAILLYASRTKKDLVFKNELESLSSSNYWFLSEERAEAFEFGRIDPERIARLVPELKERDAYVCGPVPMIHEITSHLIKLGIPKEQIHSEIFGY